MATADTLVLPSKPTKYWEEYFGMALIEAMASGLPIVTTNCGAIPEVVGSAGHIVSHSSAKSLYKGLKFVIENSNFRMELRERGLARVRENYDAEKQAEKLGKLYASLS